MVGETVDSRQVATPELHQAYANSWRHRLWRDARPGEGRQWEGSPSVDHLTNCCLHQHRGDAHDHEID